MATKKATTKKAAVKKTVAKKSTPKKTVAKKAIAKKATAKKASVVSRSTGEKRSSVSRYTPQTTQVIERVNSAKGMSVEDVAAHVIKGKMGTGRDRDDALHQAGHDPIVVQKEVAKQLNAAKPTPQSLPRTKRGSSWT